MDKLKAIFADLSAKFGKDWVIAGAVVIGLVLVDPGLAVIAAIGFALYKTGLLTKVIDRVKGKLTPKE